MKKLIVVISLLSSYAFASKNIDLKKAQNMMQKSAWAFEENKGQVTGADGKNVKFVFKDGNLSMFLMQTGIAYQFHKVTYPEGYKPLDKFASMKEHEKMEKLQSQIQTETYRMDVILEGANPNPKISTEGKSNDYIQYYNHNALDVRSYQKITYYDVYPNIDWVVYVNKNTEINEPKVKYDFVVHPGGDPSQIKLKTEWVEELTSNEDGSITLKNRMGSITEQRPVSFQDDKEVKTNFLVNNNTISFQLEKFNINTDIVIDPGLLWATYYGGSNDDRGVSCATDSNSNVYLAGWTASANNIASGGHQNLFGISVDAFLVKFNTNGVRQWATYYGGSNDDYGASCIADGSGNVYIAGFTNSTSNIASGGHQNAIGGGEDAFLVKFNSNGVRQWATYYGGSNDEYGASCIADSSGNVYIVGSTNSTSNIASGGYQNTIGGGDYDAFLVKFNSNGVRQWATYYGGNNFDIGYTCAADGSGNVYLAGYTNSSNNIASGGHQNTLGGDFDAFLVKFNSNGVRQWATYYGGSNDEYSASCIADGSGNVYLVGYTNSTNNIASGGHQNAIGGGEDAFLVKFNNSNSSTFNITACDSYYWTTKNKIYTTSNNTDTVKLFNMFGYDSIVTLNLTIKNNTASTYTTSACGSYYWTTKNKIYTTSNNTDTVKLINAAGCDSIVTLNLTIYPNPIPTIIKTGNVLSTQSYNSYQWLLNGVNIIGATNQSYTVALSGYYQVAVTDTNNCSGASSIGAVIVSSLNEAEKDYFKIYPNPSEKMLYIKTNESGNWQAIITDMKGSQINQMQFNRSTQLDISSYAPGVYYIQLTNKENVLSYKFIKK